MSEAQIKKVDQLSVNKGEEQIDVIMKSQRDPGLWRGKDGKLIPINGMTSEHLNKALKFASRKSDYFYERCNIMASKADEIEEEISKRSQAAITETRKV